MASLRAPLLTAGSAAALELASLVADVNANASTWWAAPPTGTTRTYGAILEDIGLPISTLPVSNDIPSSFDAREAWPACATVIGRIRDQSKCGSCWAFGTTEAFNDRYCIATGDSSAIFSPWDTASCAPGNGCSGGIPAAAWQWFVDIGVVSGGDPEDMGQGTTCQPYQFEKCWHHVKSTTYPKCPDMDYTTPACASECLDQGFPAAYDSDKHRATSSYMIRGEQQMQSEIMTYGPITVGMDVYANFDFYLGGVYPGGEATASLGGHAVKIIGWGECAGEQCRDRYLCHAKAATVTDGWCISNCLMQFTKYCPAELCECDQQRLSGSELVPYWLVANSWNEDFGENGFFRIRRGSNVCNIEGDHVCAGHAEGTSLV